MVGRALQTTKCVVFATCFKRGCLRSTSFLSVSGSFGGPERGPFDGWPWTASICTCTHAWLYPTPPSRFPGGRVRRRIVPDARATPTRDGDCPINARLVCPQQSRARGCPSMYARAAATAADASVQWIERPCDIRHSWYDRGAVASQAQATTSRSTRRVDSVLNELGPLTPRLLPPLSVSRLASCPSPTLHICSVCRRQRSNKFSWDSRKKRARKETLEKTTRTLSLQVAHCCEKILPWKRRVTLFCSSATSCACSPAQRAVNQAAASVVQMCRVCRRSASPVIPGFSASFLDVLVCA